MPVEVENTGRACLLGHEPAGSARRTFVADQPAAVIVDSFGCLSSECTTDLLASCEVQMDGTALTITTHASWNDTTRVTGICTDDCVGPHAECETPPLPAATYSVRIGTGPAITLDVPSMPEVVPCLGDEL